MSDPQKKKGKDDGDVSRRSLLARGSSTAMTLGLAGGYGAFALIAARFLYPARRQRRAWMFVSEVAKLNEGDSLLFRGPSGETINITRQGGNGVVEDFIALSSTCPHLGCQVHWESHNDRYFCPCHNGEFDATGVGTGGPPGDAGMSLPRYPLKIEQDLLYVELPMESLTASAEPEGEIIDQVEGIHGPGHDPCLARVRTSSDKRKA